MNFKNSTFLHSDNLIVSTSNNSCPNYYNKKTSDSQADLSNIPSAYQLYWEAYQAQEQFFAKGKITEAEFLAVTGQFDDADLSSALDFENDLGGTR